MIKLLFTFLIACAPYQESTYDYTFDNEDVKIEYNFVKQGKDHYLEGLVTRKDGDKLVPGLNIMSGEQLGTVTDIKGKFRLKLPAGAKGKIRFEFVRLTDDSFNYNLDEVKVRDRFLGDLTK
jgi:hypothetical protein